MTGTGLPPNKKPKNTPTFRIHAAAQMSGVSEELIRAWERRHGVLQPMRTPGGYRVYTAQDVAVLRRLKQMTHDGISIAQAVKVLPQIIQDISLGATTLPMVRDVDSMVPRWIELMVEAATQHDQPAMTAMLDDAFRLMPPLQVIDEVVAPMLRKVGERWEQGTLTVAQEHVASEAVRLKLMHVYQSLPAGGPRHALVACLGSDQHELGLWAAAVHLRHLGMRVTMLGLRTPPAELAGAFASLQPDVVALSATTDAGAEVFANTLAETLAGLPPGARVIMGGRVAEMYPDVLARMAVELILSPEGWRSVVNPAGEPGA